MSDLRQGLFDILKEIVDGEWGPYDDDDHYWPLVDAAITRLGLRQEIRTNAMSSAGMTTDTKTGETTHHSDIRHDYRWVTDWKTHMPPGVIS
jgi:hypothetical protein